MIHDIVQYVSGHPAQAYGTLFLAALLEAVPVVGSFVPGSTIILSLSALIPTGDLHIAAVLASIIIGALIGDGTAFWLGHLNQGKLDRMWPLDRYPEVVRQSEAVFEKYGSAAILAARFLPPVRAFVPVVAGTLGMTPRRFYPWSVVARVVGAGACSARLSGGECVSSCRRSGGATRVASDRGHSGDCARDLGLSPMGCLI